MNELEAKGERQLKIAKALDVLFICHGFPILPVEHKKVWLEQLEHIKTDRILWCLDQLIGKRIQYRIGVVDVFEMLPKWAAAHAAEIAAEKEAAFKAELLAPSANPPNTNVEEPQILFSKRSSK